MYKRQGEDETRYETLLREDTEQTQTLITDAGLPAPTCYTYPFGACSKESETLLKSMGFRCTLGCEERVNTITRNPDCLLDVYKRQQLVRREMAIERRQLP